MPAYVISEVEILNQDTAKMYMQLAEPSIIQYGGKYLVRGATPEIMEGEATNKKMVIDEFPNMEHAKDWYASSEYAEALRYRGKALDWRLIFVDGVTPFFG
jgi:uncharacterized protein (DUF1330 family)